MLLRMLQLVLSHTRWQAHQLNIERGVFSSGIFHSHWSIARTNRESQSMHWLIMHADQVIGGVAQMSANIKIQKTDAEIASCAEAIVRFRSRALAAVMLAKSPRCRPSEGGEF
jgi:hypothetical protein